MSDTPIYDRMGPPPKVVIPQFLPKLPKAAIDSRQLSAEMEAQADLDDKNFEKMQKKQLRKKRNGSV